jgi:hypothetical protein
MHSPAMSLDCLVDVSSSTAFFLERSKNTNEQRHEMNSDGQVLSSTTTADAAFGLSLDTANTAGGIEQGPTEDGLF